MRWVVVASLAVALGSCKGSKNHEKVEEAPKQVQSEPAPTAAPAPIAPAPAQPAAKTAAELYASCRERLEMPEAPAECKTDADCGTAGCGKEVCTTTKGASDLNTTCEDQPCFKVVEGCGCHDGKCTWNVKTDAPPAPAAPPSLPPSLPPTGAPPAAPAPGSAPKTP